MEENFEKEIKQFGRVIKKIREIRSLTQDDLVKMTGIARSCIADIEAGKRLPQGANILRLCIALKVSPQLLMNVTYAKWWRFKVLPLISPYDNKAALKNKKPSSPKGDVVHSTTGARKHTGEASKFVRSMRTKLDRGGDSEYNCDTDFNENNSQK